MRSNNLSITLVIALIISQFIAPIALAQSNSDQFDLGFSHGKKHGEMDASLIKFVWGIFLGPGALLYNIANMKELPIDRASEISDRSDEYQEGYETGYQGGFQQRSIYYTIIGWSSWILIYVVLQALGSVQ
jgi:hypothetical protein